MSIDLSPVEHKIEKTAYTLFREFTKAAAQDFPSYNFTIKDESLLPLDLRHSVESAMNSIISEKKDEDMPFKIGFFRGFVGSNLNHCWCTEYIKKRSNKYKTIKMLQMINSFLMKKENVANEINTAYYEALEKDINLTEYDSTILIDTQVIKDRMTIPFLGKIYEHFDGDCFKALDNIIHRKTHALAYKKNKSYLPNMKKYFLKDEIRNLIELNS